MLAQVLVPRGFTQVLLWDECGGELGECGPGGRSISIDWWTARGGGPADLEAVQAAVNQQRGHVARGQDAVQLPHDDWQIARRLLTAQLVDQPREPRAMVQQALACNTRR